MSDEHSELLAELALGILTGRERAATLAHVENCPRCAEELELLSRAADAVVQVAPDREPPVGFEVRLFERMGVIDPKKSRIVPSYWVLAAAAAIVALGGGTRNRSVRFVGANWTHDCPGAIARRRPRLVLRTARTGQGSGARVHLRRIDALDVHDVGRLFCQRACHL